MNQIKDKIIEFVRNSEDERLLEQVYNILDSSQNFQNGLLWNRLKEEEKEETSKSMNESEDGSNTVAHEEFMQYIRNKYGWH